MEAALKRVEKALMIALLFPFILVLRLPTLAFAVLAIPAFVTGWLSTSYGDSLWRVSILLLVGAVVVTAMSMGAALERARPQTSSSPRAAPVTRPAGKIESGVSRFNGPITSKWWGWAGIREDSPEEDDSGSLSNYREGPFRIFKIRARLDARCLARKLRS